MEEQEKFQELGLSYLYLDLIVFKVLITQAEQPGFKIWLFFLFFLFFRVPISYLESSFLTAHGLTKRATLERSVRGAVLIGC